MKVTLRGKTSEKVSVKGRFIERGRTLDNVGKGEGIAGAIQARLPF